MPLEAENQIIIRLESITKRFGSFAAVSNLSLDIKKGEVLGFLGPNGAGKSTTMKMLANLLLPTEGTIFIRNNGTLLQLKEHTKDQLLDRMGFLIENPNFYDNVTPRQILTYFAKLKGYPRDQIPMRVEKVVKMMQGMIQWIDAKIKTFSKGMRQKIGILSAIVHDPEIIVLDEPHSGLDPAARKEVRDLILKLKEMGKTIFLSSHLLYEVSEVADRVAIISHGQIIACDTLDNLEQAAQHSVIRMELLEMPPIEKLNETLNMLHPIIQVHTGLPNTPNKLSIYYNPEIKVFEIQFDGKSENQAQILRALITHEIEVIDFSVPRSNLLEDLYLNFISKSDQQDIEVKKESIKVEAAF